MDLVELRQAPHLSASAINDYLECGLLYKFSRIDRYPRAFRTDSLELGSAIHRTLAEFYRARQNSHEPSLDEVLISFEFYWMDTAEDQSDIQYSPGKDFNSLMFAGKELLKAFYANLPPVNGKVISIEEPFLFTLEEIDLPIIGVFDLVEEDESGTIIITDWKTSGRAYNTAEVDKHLQMGVYHMAVKANGFRDRPVLLRLDCLIKTKQPKFESYYSFRTLTDINRLRKKVVEVYRGIQQGIFVPNDTSWRCANCAYKIYCDSWFDQ
jgi:putative RecB family exonuclease